MVLRLISLMSWLIIFMMWLPETWFDGCSIDACYWDVCPHVFQQFGGMPGYEVAKESTEYVVSALKAMGEYQAANALVYLGIVPGVAIINGWLHRQSVFQYVAMIGSVGLMYIIAESSAPVGSMPDGGWFWYCTEWCIRLANATGLTYGGVCFLLFVVAIPSVLTVDMFWGIHKRRFQTDLTLEASYNLVTEGTSSLS
jgi:hypothetical protein